MKPQKNFLENNMGGSSFSLMEQNAVHLNLPFDESTLVHSQIETSCFFCKEEGIAIYGLNEIDKIMVCQTHLLELKEKDLEKNNNLPEHLLMGNKIDLSLNECDVIGCNEHGNCNYGFDELWKVRLCNKHLNDVIMNNLQDLETLHEHEPKNKIDLIPKSIISLLDNPIII